MSYLPLTSYQIPFQPLINTTRQQIERSLFSLEQKLRRRRQIDLQTQIHLQVQLSRPVVLQTYYQNLREIEERDRIYNQFAQDEILKQQAINSYHHNHFNRIEELKYERDQLVKQNIFHRTYAPTNLPTAIISSDEQLIRKYQNGSKAIQYYKELQRQQIKANQSQQPINEQVSKLKNVPQKQLFKTKRKDQGILGLESAKPKGSISKIKTPYDFLRNPFSESKNNKSTQQLLQKQVQKQKLAKELEKEFNDIHINQQKRQNQSIFKVSGEQNTKRAISPVKHLNDLSPSKQSMKRYSSLGKMPCNRNRVNLSPHRASILNESYLKAKNIKMEVKLAIKDIELQAIKKIQNRLKVSKVIYEDSQFRNVKYEGNHLFNTIEMQMKLRNQIRDKINGHPLVLKKHALIIQ